MYRRVLCIDDPFNMRMFMCTRFHDVSGLDDLPCTVEEDDNDDDDDDDDEGDDHVHLLHGLCPIVIRR